MLLAVCLVCLVLSLTPSLECREESGGGGDAGGPLVLVGGGLYLENSNTEVWDTMVELSGGKGMAKIGVVTAASENPEEIFEYYVDMFSRFGAASVVWIPVQESDLGAAFDEDVVETVLEMGGIFFSGGEPRWIVSALFTEEEGVRYETPVLTAIKTVWLAGAMVGGSSAGVEVMQSNVMITGGQSWNALVYGAMTSSDDPNNLTYDPLGGLGFLEGVIIDAHFSRRGREGRLTRLVADTMMEQNGAMRGLGLDEDTAFVCQHGTCKVIGSGGVWAVDLSLASIQIVDGWWTCDQALTLYLTLDDTLNLNTWEVQFAGWKSDLVGQEQEEKADTSGKIFSCEIYSAAGYLAEYNRVVNSLMMARSPATLGFTENFDPVSFQVSFLKYDSLSSLVTRRFSGAHPVTGERVISYENLGVDFAPASVSVFSTN